MTVKAPEYRKMQILFDDGSTRIYDISLNNGDITNQAQLDRIDFCRNQAAQSLFNRLKEQGRDYGNPFNDKRVCRDPGPKAVKIIKIWDE